MTSQVSPRSRPTFHLSTYRATRWGCERVWNAYAATRILQHSGARFCGGQRHDVGQVDENDRSFSSLLPPTQRSLIILTFPALPGPRRARIRPPMRRAPSKAHLFGRIKFWHSPAGAASFCRRISRFRELLRLRSPPHPPIAENTRKSQTKDPAIRWLRTHKRPLLP